VRVKPILGIMGLLACTLAGCASGGAATPASERRAAVFFDGHSGTPASREQIASAPCDAIILGENHGHPLGLSTAAAIWSDILARSDKAALSMEFFERDEQSRLDEYLAGLTDEKAFRTRTGRTPGNYPPGHRDMIEAAKAAKRPVVAANAPRPLVRAAGKEGGYDRLRGLSPELRRLVRIPDDLPTGRYRQDYEKVITEGGAAHGPPPKDEAERKQRLDNGFRSQSLWDWTMADSIATALGSGNTPVCHVVGRFHGDFRGGLVQALEKLRPGAKIVTVSFVDEWSDTLRDDDKDRADYVIYVGPTPKTSP
jgi:uncharacterized iron-regulated protein